ncbi:hypothetical protein KXE51_003431 [Salmonella enterica]|nr:hypothetical protein [Salmonella enterica]
MTQLKNFTADDMFAFQGAEHFADGSVPRIYYFSNEEMEDFFALMEKEYTETDFVYVIHHAEGLSLGWTANGEPEEVNFPEGIMSERVEYLLEALDPHTLPLWAMSVAQIQK